jgi:hypothetical protein
LPPWRAASLTFAAPAPGAAKEQAEIPRKKSGVIRYQRVSLSDMNGEIYSNNVSAVVNLSTKSLASYRHLGKAAGEAGAAAATALQRWRLSTEPRSGRGWKVNVAATLS